ncbi:flippase [Candidatus Woesearchaeota archaeon]|nr:flippase [Candidatus Woesearchaeota archaeon]
MSEENSLQQLIKGAGLFFLGTLFIYLMKFIYRIIVSRYLGPSDYGLLSLGEGVFNIAILLATLGISSGVIKFISHYLAKNKPEKIKGVIIASLKFILPTSIVISALMIIFSNYIAIGIFNKEELAPLLVIFALAVPFFGYSNLLTNIFIAFKKIHYRNQLNAFIRPVSSILIVILIIILKGNVYLIAIAFLVSYVLSAAWGFYLLETKTFSIIRTKIKAVFELKKLVSFSLPLFFSGLFVSIMGWIDTLFLGALRTSEEVGVYNVALPFVNTLTIVLASFGSIFFPLASESYARKEYKKIAQMYDSIARWIFLLSLPMLFIVLFFSKEILGIIFGPAYESGFLVLQVLMVAYFLKIVIGPATETMMVFHKTKTLFYINSVAVISNILLNFLFIPRWGIVGAAVATTISILIKEGTIFIIIWKRINLVIRWKEYLKYIGSGLIPLIMIYFLRFIRPESSWLLLTSIVIYLILYLVLLISFSSFTEDDVKIIEMLEKRLTINLWWLRKLMIK